MRRPGKILPLTLKQLVSKPATVSYPAGPERQFPDIRGKVVHNTKVCVGCTACMRDCPSKAIEIVRISETERKFQAFIRTDSCTFCSQCVDGCPKSALRYTSDFELAALSRTAMRYGSELPPEKPVEAPAEASVGTSVGASVGTSTEAPAEAPASDKPAV